MHTLPLQEFLRVNGPELRLPRTMTDITTATTIMQLAAPDIQLVLDPLLYLRVLPQPEGIPKLIHMTMKDKHQLAPHQILSMLSWGRFNKGYALLLYDNTDIEQYMQRYYPAFMPSECTGLSEGCRLAVGRAAVKCEQWVCCSERARNGWRDVRSMHACQLVW